MTNNPLEIKGVKGGWGVERRWKMGEMDGVPCPPKSKKTGIAQSKAAFSKLGFPKRSSPILTNSITNSPNKKTRSPTDFKILNKFKVEKTL